MNPTPDADDLFSLANIYKAYLQCRKHKRNTVNVAQFEQNLEQNLIGLRQDLLSGKYKPDTSIAFLLRKPKSREIFAADFRDRIVHHVLVGYLEPMWEKRYIYDSYACRKHKGNLAAVARMQTFLARVTRNHKRPAWYLQMDIKGYFVSIDRDILYQRVLKYCHEPAVERLLRVIIFQDLTADCRLKGSKKEDFLALPEHKTLFKAPPNKGLPIGNLTSQFFGNVYLDALDQFVKHTLKARYYARYCDDFVLLADNRQQLIQWREAIEAFLRSELRLETNDRTRLRPVSDGIDFLGYVIRPKYLLCRRRVKAALYDRLYWAGQALEAGDGPDVYRWRWPVLTPVYQWIVSYKSHFRYAADYRLWQKLQADHDWLGEYFDVSEDGTMTYRVSPPRAHVSLLSQIQEFAAALPGHTLLIMAGIWWYVVDASAPQYPWVKYSHNQHHGIVGRILKSHKPLAIITETGERPTTINTRAIAAHIPNPTKKLILHELS